MATMLQSAQSWVSSLFGRTSRRAWSMVGVNLSSPSHTQGFYFSGTTPGDVAKATAISAVHCCVSLISKTIASLPLFLYQQSGDGRTKAVDNPLYEILHSYPNHEMGAVDFFESLVSDALLYGNGFAEVERYDSGHVRALWHLPAQYIKAERDAVGQLWYFWSKGTGEEVVLPAANVVHIRTGPFDEYGIMAVPILARAAQSMGLTLSAEEVAASMMSNGLRPSAILQHPGRLTAEAVERLREDFTKVHGGKANAGKVAILENGMSFSTMATNPNDAQFLESRMFQVREVARWFGVPLSKLKAIDNPGFKTIDSENQQFLTDCLQPLLTRIEQELSLKCLTTAERRTHRIEHNLDGLLRANIERRVAAYSTARNWGWMSVNEIRRLENMDPIDGGDVYLSPINMQPLGIGVGARAPAGYQPVQDASTIGADQEGEA